MNDVLKVPEKAPEQNVEKSVEKRRLFIGDRRSHQHRRLKNISTQDNFIPNLLRTFVFLLSQLNNEELWF
jgi:hypothetical protein